MPTCKLCDQEAPLIKAHIIPKSFFPLGTGRARLFYSQEGEFPKKAPVGVYDSGILCGPCDKQLGELDQHAAEKLLRGTPRIAVDEDDIKIIEYPQAESDIVWRFALSVAWRAHHSAHDFYRGIDLGPYADRIKAVLLGNSKDESCHLWVTEFDQPEVPFVNPGTIRIDQVKFVKIYAGRFVFYLKVDGQLAPIDLRDLSLPSKTPPFTILMPWDESPERTFMKGAVVASRQNRDVVRKWQDARGAPKDPMRAFRAVLGRALG